MKSFVFTVAVAAASLGSVAYAQTNQQCQGDICYSLNIPASTSNTGDIFFQISAPTSYEWVALGQGSRMSGSNIFVMYQSADGNNVTISPRLGTGHQQPQHDTAAQITLLEGSGLSNGNMVANVRCANCDSWSGGDMDFSTSSASWIYASRSGTPILSDDLSESISQHGNDYGSFDFDFSAARGGSSVNPFVAASSGGDTTASGAATTAAAATGASTTRASTTCTPAASQTLAAVSGGSGCPTAWPTEFSSSWPTARPTWASSCFASGRGQSWPTNAPWNSNDKRDSDDACENGSSSSGSNNGNSGSSSSSNHLSNNGRNGAFGISRQNSIVIAHGVIASLAFLVLFPVGGILIRVASFTGLVWVHAALQIVAFLLYIVAFGMGIWLAKNGGYMSEAHPIIGVVLFLILIGQPISGFIHHRLYKKHQTRTGASWVHIGMGRAAIILGMINGGLGLKLAGNTNTGHVAAYGAIAGLFGLAYIISIVYGERKRKQRGPPTYQDSQKQQHHQLHDMSSHSSQDYPVPPPQQNQEWYAKQNGRHA